MDDESDAKKFQFVFYCDCCGQGYRSAPIRFSVAGTSDHIENFTAAQKLIYEAEYEDAYERGNRNALITFKPCEVCRRRVCEDCTDGQEFDHICSDCRAKQ
jgi:hypothetical protein